MYQAAIAAKTASVALRASGPGTATTRPRIQG